MGLFNIFFPTFFQLSIELNSGYEFSKFRETLSKPFLGIATVVVLSILVSHFLNLTCFFFKPYKATGAVIFLLFLMVTYTESFSTTAFFMV